MNREITHRGPDGEGYWLWDGRSPTGESIPEMNGDHLRRRCLVSFGHSRLALYDLSERGKQPMSSIDGKLWITFNGIIYNYADLRSRLAKLNYTFRTDTDTEVILNAYAHWGADCFALFNGMWSLAIADLRKQILILSRDRLGIKPLYFMAHDNGLLFASEIKQFFGLQFVKPVANMDSIAEYIGTGYEDPRTSFFQHIHPFSPGCWSQVPFARPSCLAFHAFWRTPLHLESEINRVEILSHTRALLEDCVKLCLNAHVPKGLALSGGIDSSLILAAMRVALGDRNPIPTFSAVFDNPLYDERKHIEIALKTAVTRSHYVTPNPKGFFDDLDDFIYHHDEPPGSLSQYAGWCVMRLAKSQGVTVVLNGQGADELFSGYWPAYYLFLRQMVISSPLMLAAHLLGALSPGGNQNLLWMIPPHWHRFWHRILGKSRKLLKPLWQSTGYTPLRDWARIAQHLSPQEYRMHELRYIHLPRLLKWEDRNSMAFGISGHYPFLDYRLVEWALSLPIEMNLSKGWNKLLLREAMSGALPKEVLWRKSKIGFETPQSEWIRTAFAPTLLRWVDQPSEQLAQIVQISYLKELLNTLCRSARLHKMDERQLLLMRLFFLDRWFKRFDVSL